MTRGPQDRIAAILSAIERCQRYAASLGSTNADLAEMAMDAIERNLQIVGEAANALPAELTAAHPEIAWPQVRGFRNILVHEYFGVDHATVREVIATHLPTLVAALRQHSAD